MVRRTDRKGILFAGLIAVALSGCKPAEPIILRTANISRIEPGKNGEPVMYADVTFYNPNSTTLRLKEIQLGVILDGDEAARIDQKLNALVKGNSTFTVPLEVQLHLKEGLLGTLLNLFGGKKHQVKFTGSIKVRVALFPVRIPVEYEGEVKF